MEWGSERKSFSRAVSRGNNYWRRTAFCGHRYPVSSPPIKATVSLRGMHKIAKGNSGSLTEMGAVRKY
jgi:hypothetical protein